MTSPLPLSRVHSDLLSNDLLEDAAPPPAPVGRVAVALALVALIAVGTSDEPVWQWIRVGPTDRSEILIDLVPLTAVALLLALTIAAFVHRGLASYQSAGISPRRTVGGTLAIASVVFTCLALVTIARSDLRVTAGDGLGDAVILVGGLPGVDRPFGTITDTRQGALAGEDRREEASGAAAVGRGVREPKLLVSLGLAAVAIIAMVLAWHRRRSDRYAGAADGNEGDTDAELDHLRVAVADTIDAMLADRDPQRAIIGAYARLLEALAAGGVPRREYEGPLEHLLRVLTIRRVRPGPLRTLIALFEIARFSTRPLTPEHREQALAALRAAAADLEIEHPMGPTPITADSGGAPG